MLKDFIFPTQNAWHPIAEHTILFAGPIFSNRFFRIGNNTRRDAPASRRFRPEKPNSVIARLAQMISRTVAAYGGHGITVVNSGHRRRLKHNGIIHAAAWCFSSVLRDERARHAFLANGDDMCVLSVLFIPPPPTTRSFAVFATLDYDSHRRTFILPPLNHPSSFLFHVSEGRKIP